MDLTTSDYKKITSYYQIPKSKNKTYKELAEDVLSSKLCKCIKSVDSYNQSSNTKPIKLNDESIPISICRKNIFKIEILIFINLNVNLNQNFYINPSLITHFLKHQRKYDFK